MLFHSIRNTFSSHCKSHYIPHRMQCTLKVVRFYLFTIFCVNHLPLSFQRTTKMPFWWIGSTTEAVEFALFLMFNNCFPSTPHKTTSVIFSPNMLHCAPSIPLFVLHFQHTECQKYQLNTLDWWSCYPRK